MMAGTKEYNMAVALLNFRAAYKQLVAASKQLPDLDLTTAYPFYLLDFEEIEPAVLNWCAIHAGKLLDGMPDIVDNPACLDCDYLQCGLGPDGQCLHRATTGCSVYPKIMFSREQCVPVLQNKGVDTSKLSTNDVYLLYVQEVLARAARKKNSK